ncbi:thiamine-phosphate pyrophosphorylase [Helicobacter saguini]|uniref:Thiamine-phosphate pyrophosphorylase n=1 Tax=Helicobacter saguini TaxID=1548018 RepID=A0A347VN00_9HELI|nr:hypothetical protein [Helicobacter saguini]MWV61957.1 thiamine-phosphate pyrophosphorylase [Helicobacter saguini]MWV67368.1 thiamine-phosphate pyrophosphorylase [Helicobacter saguini]MWV69721.1 thiamine-phosphate pyrophosphorylase [Helicobacter saguini]MWV73062.1 thiamine-phosphate pyrophosphorylase [Helicobacter saguini]TLD95564.1 thiamine-phosphate pyrophosphorylase [Helicobacter saguini]
MHSFDSLALYRILDANLNRLKEALRVIEDIMRFIYDEKDCTSRLKALRHRAILACESELLQSRDVIKDVGKTSIDSECVRENLQGVLSANFHRAFESARVLEEILKIESCHSFGDFATFKAIRYECYNLHKEILCSLSIH